MTNSIIVEREVANLGQRTEIVGGARGDIVSTIMADLYLWRRLRDGTFEALWDEFYAKWRGFWSPDHKSYKSERSRLISPLTQMAIDLTTAEIIEAVLGREYFIDLPDNIGDEEPADMLQARNQLVEDLRREGFADEFAVCALNGSLYGTGIFKIQIGVETKKTLSRNEKGVLRVEEEEVVKVRPIAIEPGSFVYDPGATSIDNMKGCAHEFQMPLHKVRTQQSKGRYYNDMTVSAWNARKISPNRGDTEEGNLREQGEVVYISEYYGVIPSRLFMAAVAESKGQTLPNEMILAIPEHDVTEVIATIANESQLLRVIENPLKTGERLIVSYQHETVPNRFPGRGVAEKALNVQRAMDAEMRARIDALAWSNNPMFAGDLTRMPPNSNLNAWPGKFWGTRGDPDKVMKEFKISGPDQNTFAHTQELERMGQQATGALDSSSMRQGMRDETATGSALAASSSIKRSKRTMYNIEGMLNRLVTRVLRLKMQFEPQKYPEDFDFCVRGTIGIMAREVEVQQMTQLVGILGADSPATQPIVRAIFEHSSSPVKQDVLDALKAQNEKKPSPEEEAAQAAQMALPVAQLEKIKAETFKITEEGQYKDAQEANIREITEGLDAKQNVENIIAMNDLQETDNQRIQLQLQADKNDIERSKLKLQAFSTGAKVEGDMQTAHQKRQDRLSK